MTYLLGISAYYHDSAAAIIKDGEIIAAAQEERFTRIKQDSNFPVNAVNYCLSEAGIEPEQLDGVVYYEKPFVKFERILETAMAYVPCSMRSFINAMPVWLNKKLFIPSQIDKHFEKRLKCPIYFTTHHEAHCASAFYPSPFEEAAILCLDGVGEWDTTTWGIGKGNKIEIKQKIEFPHSLGLLYSAFTGFLGFKVNSGEYKVMGLAPYGEPVYKDLILENLIDVKEDGSFWLNQKYFGYCTTDYMFNKKFEKLFNRPARKPESALSQNDMDIAASLQAVTEEIILKLANYVYAQTGLKNLCLAGGCALNCVSNGNILKNGKFENIWTQPAAGDAGGALGAALAVFYMGLNNGRTVNPDDSQAGSLLGPEYSDEQIIETLNKFNAKYTKYETEEEVAQLIAKYISEGKSIGHFAGRMEYGPRALGNRSILADPRNKEMQRNLNLAIKKRESFRPFAPSCLEEDVEEFFDIKKGKKSPYMLLTQPISDKIKTQLTEEEKNYKGIDKLKACRSTLPAITHVNYSARIQTVSKKVNPRYWNIINEFKKLTACSVIVNTSFNIRGEPIVNTPENAFKCFMFTDLDVLVLENFVLLKQDQTKIEGIEQYQKQFKLD
ncbi:MAG: carbamoyltransferase [Candidatus Gastranaerophilales bacterium]|nr:carbamoyltransferase [Candidatus Gastranaerophilales bacterium]